jgi:predicted ATPase
MVRHVVLTGGPGAGKTALLCEAERAGLTTSPEVARALLKQPGGMALRVNDPLGFADAMLAAHLAEYERFQEVRASLCPMKLIGSAGWCAITARY